MRVKKLFLLLIIFFWIHSLSAQINPLTTKDIPKVMDQLFEYHIDKKEMTPLIIQRSLKIYVENFDPNKAYLLAEEARVYTEPDDFFIKSALSEYQKNQFEAYFNLNKTIEKSILRARQWRKEWEVDPKKLLIDAKAVSSDNVKNQSYSTFLKDLKQKHYQQFLKIISIQLKQLPQNSLDGKENKIVALCEKQLSLLENEYLGLDDQSRELTSTHKNHQIVLRILKALSHSLDAHTAYYSPEEALAMKVQLEKGMCGIGVVLHESIEGVVIAEIIKGGPAEKAGALHVGDTIVEIDGQVVSGYSFHKVLETLRGGEGTKTVLGIQREVKESPGILRVELIRERITLEDKRVDISTEPFGDGYIGKITLYSFYEGDDGISSEKDIRKAVEQLRAKGTLYGLVLDMRENTGGFLSQAVRVSGLFISNGVVVVSKYSDGTMKYYRSLEGKSFYEGPLIILVSRSSASATEIVAQTLQDYGVALVVGDEQTYGKGTIQHQTITNDKMNSFFKVTIGKYYTASGKSTQIEGVKADIVVPTDYNFEELGEVYLDYPLPADQISSSFQDPLSDIDPYARRWYTKYYLPNLQSPILTWKNMLGTLRENSQNRIAENANFQIFLQEVQKKVASSGGIIWGKNDLQMEEAINIVKDMIYLNVKQTVEIAD